ncbi:hypothetical protein AB0M28_05950 [Streptomyces sp. NPDC051940]|uniref:hypothetical protein n=1 Tax=Streptomyces sp. NPDC051940 TaxID=3155675 RepID=UPI00341E5962
MDLESVVRELYSLPPDQFVAVRTERAAAARKAKEPALAKEIGGLRRPTLAAWASNLLVHSAPREVEGLLALGAGLRQAQQQLAGDRLRELTRQRNALVAQLARQAGTLAAEAGQRISADALSEVESTLHAVLADETAAAQWASGRLVKPLSASTGFPGTAPAHNQHIEPPPAARPRPAADLMRARTAAAEAELAVREAAAELEQAAADREQCAARVREADAREKELAGELEAVRAQGADARTALGEAEHREDAAVRTAEQARSAAQEAVDEVARLESESSE